jgi:regulator of telomere elongation helicase 1
MSFVMESAISLLTDAAVEAGRRAGARGGSYRLSALSEALALGFSTLLPRTQGGAPPHAGYRVHVHLEKPRGGGGGGGGGGQGMLTRALPTLSYWCFSPGQSMAALAGMRVRSMLLTSGTLSPLDSFAHELGLPFPVRLENPHVVDPSQVWVGVVPVGPSGHALNSRYATRNSRGYKEDLGNAIVNFARIVPDGLLVFFPSYGLMAAAIEAWKLPGSGGISTWERIAQYKPQVVEPREAALFPHAAADFAAKLADPADRGAAFFAVCRGKVSEGLDFSDRAGRAVIITGIPYATRTDAKVQIKMDVLNDALRARNKRSHTAVGAAGPAGAGLTGDAWYGQQATRAVNQAMGRVIRHRRDFGAVILCDERFKAEGTKRQLSKWLRDGVKVHSTYGAAATSLTKFFKLQAENARKVRQCAGQKASRVCGRKVACWARAGPEAEA